MGATEAEAIRNGMVELAPQIQGFDVEFPPKAKYGAFDEAALSQYVGLLKEQGLTTATPAPSELVTDAMLGCMNGYNDAEVREKAQKWKS